MLEVDHYTVLGIARDADQAAVRSAYVRLVKRLHPDSAEAQERGGAKLQALQRAYQCLRESESRARYDQQLHRAELEHAERIRRVRRRLEAPPPGKRRSRRNGAASRRKAPNPRLRLVLLLTAALVAARFMAGS